MPMRRGANRSRSLLIMARLQAGAVDERCLVLDISPCGAAVRTTVPLNVDARVRLDIGACLTAIGTVRWNRHGHGGVEFDQPVDLAPLLAALGVPATPGPARTAAAAGRRSEPRIPWSTTVELQHGDERCAGELHDVSATGGRINLASTRGLQRGERVVVRIDDRFDGQGLVRWVTPGAIGLAFDPPLPLWRLEPQLATAAAPQAARPARSSLSPDQPHFASGSQQ